MGDSFFGMHDGSDDEIDMSAGGNVTNPFDEDAYFDTSQGGKNNKVVWNNDAKIAAEFAQTEEFRRQLMSQWAAPHIWRARLQNFLCILLLLCLLLAVVFLAVAVWHDVDVRLKSAHARELRRVQQCHRDFEANHCATLRVPAVEEHCRTLEECMSIDPTQQPVRAAVFSREAASAAKAFLEELGFINFAALVAALLCVLISISCVNHCLGRTSNREPEFVAEARRSYERQQRHLPQLVYMPPPAQSLQQTRHQRLRHRPHAHID
ncbi:MAG: hypothetical protein MHM6MM_006049 [Cercozoa sp. M6MM]